MNEDLVGQYVDCFLRAVEIEGSMEQRLPLYKAQEIQKKLTQEETGMARKQVILTLLANQNYSAALTYLEDEFFDTPELTNNDEIKTAATKACKDAEIRQLEIAGELRTTFNLN